MILSETKENAWESHIFNDYGNVLGKRIVIRVDWNMPIKNGTIIDTTRADVTFPFLHKLLDSGAKLVILSHFGEKGESLEPIAHYVQKEFPTFSFTKTLDFTTLARESESLLNGSGMILENVRLWQGETECLPSLSSSFASLGDIFINDAFSVSHRNHSSVVGIAKLLPSYLGPTCTDELSHLQKALLPVLPALLIVGGAKISTKLPLIKHYLDLGVKVFVGGGMVHNIWKEQGFSIGDSFCDRAYHVPPFFLNHPLLLTPSDVKLDTGEVVEYTEIPQHGVVVDLGTKSIEELSTLIASVQTVIINGPLGLYEKGWLLGTEKVLQSIAHSHAFSYIGGGDTVTVANNLNIHDKFTFVSLGGGAMLDYLSSGTLPGIDVVTK